MQVFVQTLVGGISLGAIYALVYDHVKAEGPESLPNLVPMATYMTLAPFLGAKEAFALAVYIGQGVRKVSGTQSPLTVTRTIRAGDGIHATGFAFDIRRRYRSGAQAGAFQFMLDRLQALNLVAWTRNSDTIHITASDQFDFTSQ